MQNPVIGLTYTASIDPSLRILVESFTPDKELGFIVEGCDPADCEDMQGMGYEFTQEEWQEHGFTLDPA